MEYYKIFLTNLKLIKKYKTMGKLLVKWGLALQLLWKKLMCKWNWLVSKLIVNVDECPIAQCTCKK